MKVAIVVQRYGADINGGAELHARYIAEHLAPHAEVRVLTTCARDYLTWRNEFPPGADRVNGIPVERFPVEHERRDAEFGLRSDHVFGRRHSLNEELEWLDSEGPASPALVDRLRISGPEFDHVLLFCARYYHAYHGARAVPERAILVPTAERDAALGLAMFGPIFRGVRAIMYNSPEEQVLIQAAASNEHVPGVVVGIGSEIPGSVDPRRAAATFGLTPPYVIYVGRIDANKGCVELFDFFVRYAAARPAAPTLVLVGTPVLAIPEHPRIRHLGFLDDRDKFDAIAGSSTNSTTAGRSSNGSISTCLPRFRPTRLRTAWRGCPDGSRAGSARFVRRRRCSTSCRRVLSSGRSREVRLRHATVRRRNSGGRRARVPPARRAAQPAPRRRSADDRRPRSANVEERVRGRRGPRPRRARAPLHGEPAARRQRVPPVLRSHPRRAAVPGRGDGMGSPARTIRARPGRAPQAAEPLVRRDRLLLARSLDDGSRVGGRARTQHPFSVPASRSGPALRPVAGPARLGPRDRTRLGLRAQAAPLVPRRERRERGACRGRHRPVAPAGVSTPPAGPRRRTGRRRRERRAARRGRRPGRRPRRSRHPVPPPPSPVRPARALRRTPALPNPARGDERVIGHFSQPPRRS